jgi:RNA polymerase sigma-70 factor (ECF subfamily)
VASLPGPAPEPDHAEQVADRIGSEARMRAVLDQVRALPAREREVLALVVWAGLSYEQAAAALDVPVGTVRSRLSRARARLTQEASDE